jgi:hypothetical protein
MESWKVDVPHSDRAEELAKLWKHVDSLEPISRNLAPTELSSVTNDAEVFLSSNQFSSNQHFVPLHAVLGGNREVNE